MNTFGKNLQTIMKQRKITAAELSRAIQIPTKSVQEWTQRDRFPRDPAVLKRLCEYLECSVHKLLYGEEDPMSNPLEAILEKTEIHTGMYEISIKKVNPKGK